MEDLKTQRRTIVSDIDIYKTVLDSTHARQVLTKLRLDFCGKSYNRVKKIMEKYNIKFKNGLRYGEKYGDNADKQSISK